MHNLRKRGKSSCVKTCVGFNLTKPSSINISGGKSITTIPVIIRDTIPSTDPLLKITNNNNTKTYFSVGPTETVIDGKLTVTGLIDPTGLVLTKQPIQPTNTTTTSGLLWITDNDMAVQTTKINPTPTPGLLFTTQKEVYDNDTGTLSLFDIKTPVVQSLDDVMNIGNVSTTDLVLDNNTSLFGKGSLNLGVIGGGDINLGPSISVNETVISSLSDLAIQSANSGKVTVNSLDIDNDGNVENVNGNITLIPKTGFNVQINSGLSIDGMASLNYYDTISVTRITNGGWTPGYNVTVKLTRIGNIVTLQIPTLLQPNINVLDTRIVLDSLIPLVYRTSTIQRFPVLISDDDVNKIGILQVDADVVSFYVDTTLTAPWTISVTGIAGFYGTNVSWLI